MKLLQIYNQYRSMHGGEETVVNMTENLVKKNGGEASLLMRSSREIGSSVIAKAQAFASGIYSRSGYREVMDAINREKPDVVHAHNVYPLYSPSVFQACHKAKTPIVYSHHNYMITCPAWHHLRDGSVCEKCTGGKEYFCAVHNCRGSMFESVGYAVRSTVARTLGFFKKYVNVHIVLSEFAKERLIRMGIEAKQIAVLPNMVALDHEPIDASHGKYIAFSGRMSREKGIDTLLDAIRDLPNVEVRLAGDGPELEALKATAPPNAKFLGRLDAAGVFDFYRQAKFLAIPSKWFEGCPLVVSEAMSHGLPVVSSRIGGLPEFVDEGETGYLFETGNVQQLRSIIEKLWASPDSCRQLGTAGRLKAEREYSEETYFNRLLEAYKTAANLVGKTIDTSEMIRSFAAPAALT